MPDDPRARNNARFAEYMRRLHSGPQPLDEVAIIEASGDGEAFRQAQEVINQRLRESCLNPALVMTGPKAPTGGQAKNTEADWRVVWREAPEDGPPVNTSSAHNALQRHAEGSEGHQDAKGARRAHTQGCVEKKSLARTNTRERPRCGVDGFECGWCHYCRTRQGLACKPGCHQCAMKAVDEADATAHPDEAGAILTHPADVNKGKKKIERVRGFQI